MLYLWSKETFQEIVPRIRNPSTIIKDTMLTPPKRMKQQTKYAKERSMFLMKHMCQYQHSRALSHMEAMIGLWIVRHLNIWWDTKNHSSICLSMSHLTRLVRKAERQKAESRNREKLRFWLLHSALWKDNSGRTIVGVERRKGRISKKRKVEFLISAFRIAEKKLREGQSRSEKTEVQKFGFWKEWVFQFLQSTCIIIGGESKVVKT